VFLKAFGDTLELSEDAEKERRLKQQAHSNFSQAGQHMCALMRRYDPRLLCEGRNALLFLCSEYYALSPGRWVFQFAAALLDCGCDVNARDADGDTPLHHWSELDVPNLHPCGPLLLIEAGADVNAQNKLGATPVHCLASCVGTREVLRGLAAYGWLAVADLTLRDSNGETALQTAERMLAKQPNDPERREICDLLRTQTALWQSHTRPQLRAQLTHALPEPGLADEVLSFAHG